MGKHRAITEDLLLLTTMPVEKSEDIVGPDGGSKVTERVAVLPGVPIGGIDLHLVRFPRVLHDCGEDLARRQVIIVLGLEKKYRRVRISNRSLHQRLPRRRVRPALGCPR